MSDIQAVIKRIERAGNPRLKQKLVDRARNKIEGTFLFNSDLLFSDERNRVLAGEVPDQQKVIPLVLRCINVEYAGNSNFMGSATWRFQVQGHGDNWYRTHYDWALVKETPENLHRAQSVKHVYAEIDALRIKAKNLSATIEKVKVPK